jgi:glycosyltransferase involved in cell wall biosynthesis
MFQFRDKTVFIISPERWGAMKVSKHHYAIELAEINCRVFFIEPPSLHLKGISVTACEDHANIQLVKYKPVFRGKRFLPAFVFSFLLRWQVKKLMHKIGVKPEVILCFHGYLFQNLKLFSAAKTIFFAADQFYYNYLPPEIYSADFSLAVSDTIFERIQKGGKQVFFINHGLQKTFVRAAEELLKQGNLVTKSNKITAGYIGNLRMEALDRETMINVIKQNPQVKFIFWGSYKSKDLNLGGINDNDADNFVRFLENSPNVDLRGVVNSEQLQQQMREADLFWLCWKIGVNSLWDGSNSHKILEYLATGRPVVAHHVSSYDGFPLLNMLPAKDNLNYTQLFSQTVEQLKTGEPEDKIRARILFALENSYACQIRKIENIIAGKTMIGDAN